LKKNFQSAVFFLLKIFYMEKQKKEKAPPAKFWPQVVKTFFDFCAERFSEKPTFDGSSPRDLKGIVLALEQRARESDLEWTEEVAVSRLRKFLEAAYADRWLQENFILSNLNRQKDKIFFNAKKQTNGTAHLRSFGEKPIATVNPPGSFGKL
jgi:hypothetical protein